MLQLAACLTVIIGALLLYLSNKHQRILDKPLPKNVRLLAYLSLIGALIVWLQIMPVDTALFIWLMVTMLTLTCVPFACYFWSIRKK